jgi:hypothetical protein
MPSCLTAAVPCAQSSPPCGMTLVQNQSMQILCNATSALGTLADACSCASHAINTVTLLIPPRCPPSSALLRAAAAIVPQPAVARCAVPGAQATSSLPLPLKGFFSCVLSSEKVWLTCEWQASSARTASTTCAPTGAAERPMRPTAWMPRTSTGDDVSVGQFYIAYKSGCA